MIILLRIYEDVFLGLFMIDHIEINNYNLYLRGNLLMLKMLYQQIGEYKRDTILTPIFTALEVLMEIFIPFVIASLIDEGIDKGNMEKVYFYGGLMVVLALLSLLFGRAFCCFCFGRLCV